MRAAERLRGRRLIAETPLGFQLEGQIEQAVKSKGKGNLKDLIYGFDTWTVN